jgi:hypothetical protein
VRAVRCEMLVVGAEMRASARLIVSPGDPVAFSVMDVPALRQVVEGEQVLRVVGDALRLESNGYAILLSPVGAAAAANVLDPIRVSGGRVSVDVTLGTVGDTETYPLKGSRRALEDNAALRRMFVLICQNLHIWPAALPPDAEQPAAPMIRWAEEYDVFGFYVDLYTQAWSEYSRFGASVLEFTPLAVRLLEQRTRGNANVVANRLMIDRRVDGLGLYFRNGYPFAAYTDQGLLLRTFDGSTPRDTAFVGDLFGPGRLRIQVPAGVARILLTITSTIEADMDEAAAVAYIVRYRDVLKREIPRDWAFGQAFAKEAKADLGPLIGFLVLEAMAMFLEILPNPGTQIAGRVVSGLNKVGAGIRSLIKASGVVFFVIFAGDAVAALIEAANFLRMVKLEERNGERVPVDKLDQLYLELAVSKFREVIVMLSVFAFIWGTMALTSKLYFLVCGGLPRMRFPGGPTGGVERLALSTGQVITVLTAEGAIASTPSGGGGGPVGSALAAASVAGEGGQGGSSDEKKASDESAKIEERQIGARQEKSYEAHEREIRGRVAEHARRSGNEHQANRTLKTFHDRVLDILRSTGTDAEILQDGQTKNAELLRKTVLEFLKEIGLDADVRLLQQFYDIRVRTQAEAVKLAEKRYKLSGGANSVELADSREKLNVFKRTSEYLSQILKVTLGNKPPDNIEYTKDLKLFSLTEATERFENVIHVLKTVIDREAVKQILVNVGRVPASTAKGNAPSLFEIDAAEYYSNGTRAEMPSTELFKKGLRDFLRGGQKADLEASYGPEADALKKELAKTFKPAKKN